MNSAPETGGLPKRLNTRISNNLSMDERIYFKEPEIRIEFFENVRKEAGCKSWRELAKKFGLARTHFQDYQYGLHTIPSDRFNAFLEFLSKEKQEYFLEKISTKPKNWGPAKGGRALYLKYPEEFERRRKNGLKKLLADKNQQPYYNFDIDLPITEKLCEFLGAFIGDGFTNKYGRHYEISFAGDSNMDKNYLLNHISELAFESFGGLPSSNFFRKNANAMYLKFYSKQLFRLLTERFNFPAGVKCYSVKIPEEIMNSNEKYIFATIRGIFDTDGCVYLDKRKAYAKPYPRIKLETSSKDLFLQLKNFLLKHFKIYSLERDRPLKNSKYEKHSKTGVVIKTRNPSYVLDVYGHFQIKKWMDLIGFSNERHYSKIYKILKPLEGIEPSTPC